VGTMQSWEQQLSFVEAARASSFVQEGVRSRG